MDVKKIEKSQKICRIYNAKSCYKKLEDFEFILKISVKYVEHFYNFFRKNDIFFKHRKNSDF